MEGSEAVLVIDHSGSMDDASKMATAKAGAKSYLDRLQDTDYAATIAFGACQVFS
jgi:Mg-chelatase subunit ChlD